MVAEGVKTSASVVALGNKMGVEMPICEQVFEASANGFLVLSFLSGGREEVLKTSKELDSAV